MARRAKRAHIAAYGLLLLLFFILTAGIRPLSFTADEPSYIAGGYALLHQGTAAHELLAQRGYPPLLAGLEAALIYLAEPDLPITELAGWPMAFDPFTEAFRPYLAPEARSAFVARMPTVLLTVLLGAVVFRWGAALWTPTAGALALVTLTFDPTLLAHGRLATTDVGSVALGAAALALAWRWTQRPRWRTALGVGLLLGLTMLAKISGPLWLLAATLMMLRAAWQRRTRFSLFLQIIAALGASFLILWSAYGFTWGRVEALPFALPVPAPAHWRSALYLAPYRSKIFALGQRYYGRRWWYFPLAFAVKNPLPLLIGSLVGIWSLAHRRRERATLALLLLFPAIYGAVALATGMNIGYRHMLPLHPLLHLIVGGGLWRWQAHPPKSTHWRRGALALLAIWYAGATLHISPYELTYFNEMVGGSEEGYRYLVDSNLAWGQTTDALDDYLAEHPDVRRRPPTTPFRPAPGRYAVNASHLQGVGGVDPYAYEWFRHREPTATLHNSVLIYEAPPFDLGWIAQCGQPAALLDHEAIIEGVGRADLRSVGFDCTQAWLYPNAGASDGLYALSNQFFQPPEDCLLDQPCNPELQNAFIARHLATARLSFVHTRQRPAFVLYERSEAPGLPRRAAVWAAAATHAPADFQSTQRVHSAPTLRSDDRAITFLGAVAYPTASDLEIETWWRVETNAPIQRPFSVMAHLITSAGEALETADGLGVWAPTLRTGDVFVQRHRFSPVEEIKEIEVNDKIWLRTGIYWQATTERWPCTEHAGSDALFVPIQ